MRRIFALLICTIILQASNACTTFFLNKDGHLVFGRNYDWVTGNGMVCTNQRGLAKTSYKAKDGGTLSWISKYGSITFNQYGKEFPTGGMNEKGLVVELMWLDGTRYPDQDERPAIGVLQWIQYHLDNCATLTELIGQDKNLRISSIGTTPLHYLVADASGEVAVIEFLNGKMKVTKGKDLPFPVLTNDRYDDAIRAQAKDVQLAGYNYKYFSTNSIDRFEKTCDMVKQFNEQKINTSVVDYSFNILDQVAQGSFTKWSIVYDLSEKKIYFKTQGFPRVKQLNFSAFDFNCSVSSRTFDMNQSIAGEVSSKFENYLTGLNAKMVNRSFDESIDRFEVEADTRKNIFNYPSLISCSTNR